MDSLAVTFNLSQYKCPPKFRDWLIRECNSLLNIGTVKFSAKSRDNLCQLSTKISTLFRLIVTTSILIGLLVFFLNGYLSEIAFRNTSYQYLFRILGVLLLVLCINQFFISLLNGRGEIKKYVLASMVGSVFCLVITLTLIYFFGLEGTLISIVFGGTGLIFFSIYLLYSCDWFSWSMLWHGFDRKLLNQFLSYSMIGLFTGISLPLTQLFTRSYLASHLSWEDAGYWQAMNRIVSIMTSIFMSGLSLYYIPVLSSLHKKVEIRKEIFKVYKLIIPLLVLACGITWLLRKPLICFALTKQFLPMEQLFSYQLLALVFQMMSWVIFNLMWAKGMCRSFIAVELFFVALYVLSGVLCVNYFGFRGMAIAPCINYGLLCLLGFIAFYYWQFSD